MAAGAKMLAGAALGFPSVPITIGLLFREVVSYGREVQRRMPGQKNIDSLAAWCKVETIVQRAARIPGPNTWVCPPPMIARSIVGLSEMRPNGTVHEAHHFLIQTVRITTGGPVPANASYIVPANRIMTVGPCCVDLCAIMHIAYNVGQYSGGAAAEQERFGNAEAGDKVIEPEYEMDEAPLRYIEQFVCPAVSQVDVRTLLSGKDIAELLAIIQFVDPYMH